MSWSSISSYMLAGTVTSGLTLDITNAGGGSPLAGWNTYDDGTYDDEKYTPTAFWQGKYTTSFNNNSFDMTYVGDTGDVKYQYAISYDGATFTSWSRESDVDGNIRLNGVEIKLRFIYYSPLWSDPDSITIATVSRAFYPHVQDTVIRSAEVNDNFYYMGGDRLPYGGTYLEPTDSVYNLGSSDYKWRTIYANSVTIYDDIYYESRRVDKKVLFVIASAASSRVEITGINDTNKETIDINFSFISDTTTSGNYGIAFNGVSGTTYQRSGMIIQYNKVTVTALGDSAGALQPYLQIGGVSSGCQKTGGFIKMLCGHQSYKRGFSKEISYIGGTSGALFCTVMDFYTNIENTLSSIAFISTHTNGIGVNSSFRMWIK